MGKKRVSKNVVDNTDLVKKWADDHACDKSVVTKVGDNNFRVNLYRASGEIIRTNTLFKSFYVTTEDGVVVDKTI